VCLPKVALTVMLFCTAGRKDASIHCFFKL
jgi:hypothetical protein